MSFEYEPDCLGLYPDPHNFGHCSSKSAIQDVCCTVS